MADIKLLFDVAPAQDIKSKIQSLFDGIQPKLRFTVKDEGTGKVTKVVKEADAQYQKLNSTLTQLYKTRSTLKGLNNAAADPTISQVNAQIEALENLKRTMSYSEKSTHLPSFDTFVSTLTEAQTRLSEINKEIARLDSARPLAEQPERLASEWNKTKSLLSDIDKLQKSISTGKMTAPDGTLGNLGDLSSAVISLRDNLKNLSADEAARQIADLRVKFIELYNTTSNAPSDGIGQTIVKDSKEYAKALNDIVNLRNKAKAAMSGLDNGTLLGDESTANGIRDIVTQLDDAEKALTTFTPDQIAGKVGVLNAGFKDLVATLTKVKTTASDNPIKTITEGSTQYFQYLKQAQSMMNTVKNLQDRVGTGKGVANKATVTELRQIANEIQSFQSKLNGMETGEAANKMSQLQQAVTRLQGAVRSSGSIFSNFFSGIGAGFSQYITTALSGYQVIMKTVQEIKQMISTAIELDSAFTQLQIVTGASDSTMSNFASTIATTAKDMSASVKDLTEVATVYSRLGYSLDESNVLAKYTAMLQNVGDIDPSAASDSVTAIVKAYGKGVEDIEGIMDKMVVVGKNYCPAA